MIPDRFVPLIEGSAPIAKLFREAGKEIYLVGGIVRDALAGRERHLQDFDYTTNAHPSEIKKIVAPAADAIWTQGEKFGTIGLSIGDVKHEITTHRAEVYNQDSRKPEVEFADAVEADLSRRDFTVNAIALALDDEPRLIDPFNGLEDLHNLVLRTPIDPMISFSDDPLRMMRAARFIAGFGLVPQPQLLRAVEELGDRLKIVSSERIRDELDKLLVVTDPSTGLWFLVRSGLAQFFLPELPNMEVAIDPIHQHKEVLSHSIAVVNNCEPERVLRLAALFHDIAKPKTKKIDGNKVTFHHHDLVGARMTRDRMRALKYSNEDVTDVSELVALHLRFHTYRMGWTDSAVRRYVRDAGPLLERLNKLTRADCTTRNKAKAAQLSLRMDELEERIVVLQSQEELAALRPEIDGAQVMEHLGIGPSKAIGEALDFLMEIRLDEGLIGEDEIFKRLDAWWGSRS